MEEDRSAFKILTGTLKGKRPLGRPRRRYEDNITMDLKEIVINTNNLADSTQNRDYWRALNLRNYSMYCSLNLIRVVKSKN